MRVGTDWLEKVMEQELFDTLCGDRLGTGMSRQVYECKIDPSVVVKIEDVATGHRQNIFEWETWREVEYTPYQHWFAPCVSISDYGGVLLQKKTRRPSKRFKYPQKMPVFLGDFKYTNYGMFKGRLCAHDYGRNLLMQHGLCKRDRKVDWWDEDELLVET